MFRHTLFIFFISFSALALTQIEGTDLISGKSVALSIAFPKKLTVVSFLSSKCPCSQSHEPSLEALSKAHPDTTFVGVVSNKEESTSDLKKHFAKSTITFPVVKDKNQRLANHFKARKTPHVFVLNEKGQTLFRGGIDDCHQAEGAKRFYLKRALKQIKQTGKADPSYVRVLGCAIER